MNELSQVKEADLVNSNPIMLMVQTAVSEGNVNMVKELLAIRDSEENKAAERAFNSAYSLAQSKIPIIPKRGKGHNNITYSRIEDIMQAVMPVLAEHGLSLRHKTDNSNGSISVTAVLSHVNGHSETDTIVADSDKSGSKNAIQAVKSTITYLRRATAENILGLSSYGEDDDAFNSDLGFDTTPWSARILDAKSMDELVKIGADLKAETMPHSARTLLQGAWAGKAGEIKKGRKNDNT